MLRRVVLGGFAAVSMIGAAQAQDDAISLSGGYTQTQLDDFTVEAFTLRGGYDFTPNFGIEAQLDIGLGDDTRGTCPAGATCLVASPSTGLDYGLGVFAVGRLPLGERASLFARGGYMHSDFSTNVVYPGGLDEQSWAWGVGAEFDLTERGGLRLDYTRTDYDGLGRGDSFGISWVQRFGG